MINVKQTLKKWHEEYPNLDTDTLLGLLDGISENYCDCNNCYCTYTTATYGSDYDLDTTNLS